MPSKVRVFGKAQNRTALGIANAFLVMYPHATLEDLNKAFPIELNTSSPNSSVMFEDIKNSENYKTKKEGKDNFARVFFAHADDYLHLQDGTKAVMLQMWTKDDFQRIVSHAKNYDIEIADFQPREGFRRGGFHLEYLNGYIPPAPLPSEGKPWWFWLLLGLLGLLLLGLLFFLFGRKKEIVEVEREVLREVIVRDTVLVYVQQLAEIEKNFNAVQFAQGRSELRDEAKFVLHDLARLLNSHPDMKVRIIGHTSREGAEDLNQRLSEARAKAAVDFLVKERGIDASRLEFRGAGSSEPLDPDQLDVNRRTEFVVIE